MLRLATLRCPGTHGVPSGIPMIFEITIEGLVEVDISPKVVPHSCRIGFSFGQDRGQLGKLSVSVVRVDFRNAQSGCASDYTQPVAKKSTSLVQGLDLSCLFGARLELLLQV